MGRVKFLLYEDYEADASSVSSWSERIRILPCLQRPEAGSVALNVLNVILLKADAVLRAKVIASNSEESLLITPAEMRKSNSKKTKQNQNKTKQKQKQKNKQKTKQQQQTKKPTTKKKKQENDLSRIFDRG